MSKKLENVTVGRGSEYSDYALQWQAEGARFHVWVSADGRFEVRPELFKNPLEPRNRHQPGYFATRHLDVTVPKNKLMIENAMQEAKLFQLFQKCDAGLAEEARKKEAERAEWKKLQWAKEAGPQMLVVLKAIGEFFGTNANYPLSPGALLLESDEETIADAVKRVILLAETGGAVAL